MTEQAGFDAIGTRIVVSVADSSRLQPAVDSVRELVNELDLACSRFRDDSELSALNAAGGSAVRVGPLLLDALDAALKAAAFTDGDVDPTVGHALIALGYDRDFSQLRERDSVQDGRPAPRIAAVPGWRAVKLDRKAGTARIPRGVTLDLGSTAKALGADLAAKRALGAAGCGVLVSLGGDIAIAGAAPGTGWPVYVTDDIRNGTDGFGQWIELRSGGLATSSTVGRRWRTGERDVHHLLDPRTGRPATGPWRTVSVAAGSCLEANVASTAAVVRGERAPEWLESLRLPSRLVRTHGEVTRVAGWPEDDHSAESSHQ